MANRDVIIFKSKANRNSTHSKYTFRAIVRYSIIFTMSSLIAFLLFSLGSLQNVTSDFSQFKEENMSKLVAIALIVSIGVIAVKMNQTSFNASALNIVMVVLCIGYAAFIAIYFRDYKVDELKNLQIMYHFAWPVAVFLTVWYFLASYVERKTRPQLSKYMIWRAISAINIQVIVWLCFIYAFKFTSLIRDSHDSFDKENPLHLLIVVSAALLLLGEIAQTIVRVIKYRTALSREEILKSVSLAIVFMTTIPLTIWFVFNYIIFPKSLYEFLFSIVPILVMGFGLWVTLLRKGRVSSPVISTTIYSISIVMIWTNKFSFDSFQILDINPDWEMAMSLIAMATIVIFMFIKNNPASLMQSISQIIFALLVSAFILGNSVIAAFPDSRDTLNASLEISVGMSWDEALNIIMLTSSAGLALSATSSWYKIQAKINHNLSIKLRKGGKHA